MKKAVKIWLIIAAVLVVAGIGLMTAALAAVNFDITELSTVRYETNTYKVTDPFTEISIEENTTDIEFALTDKKQCSVVCAEPEKVRHSVSVKNGTLTIKTDDNRQWYEFIGISFEAPKMTVYLPEKQYAALTVNSDTGNITIPDDFSFDSVDIKGSTGNVDCAATVKDALNIDTSTGNIKLKNATAGKLSLSAATGNVKLDNTTVMGDIAVKTNTGNIPLTRVIAKGRMELKSDTGNITFDGCDAAALSVRTVTGNINGSLLTAKRFTADSDTGNVSVPNSAEGGECELKTNTGNIKITLK